LIGVIPKPNQVAVVREFFELFKTPWELYRPGQTYDVVIATADDLPEIKSRLLIVYGSNTKSVDARVGITAGKHYEQTVLSNHDTSLPIYGELLTFEDNSLGVPCVTANSAIAGLRVESGDCTVMRLGYDLFDEVEFLLSSGQPVAYAHIPTLDIHIGMLRTWILNGEIPLVEILPTPAGFSFAVCLTHDIDFVGIRNHKFDHTMWGFAYRATVGALLNFIKGRISAAQVLKSWRAVVSLPLVYAGWARDFWEPFEWYLQAEKDLPTSYFLIPFKGCAGDKVPGPHASRRAAAYKLEDLSPSISKLKAAGCELGVHGVDAWHSVEKGRVERARIEEITGECAVGIRMHWLLQDANTTSTLEQSGYTYDSTVGYNETIGYRAGTGQVYRPLGARNLLELPVHIQDGALFYPGRMNLSETEAENRCGVLIQNARKFGGVLTVIWHDRSHAPERFWGDFYVKLLRTLRLFEAWFGTAGEAVDWFRKRREVQFERVESSDGVRVRPRSHGGEVWPPFTVRRYEPLASRSGKAKPAFVDIVWNGKPLDELEDLPPGQFSTLAANPTLS
jgi:hypothetical protein